MLLWHSQDLRKTKLEKKKKKEWNCFFSNDSENVWNKKFYGICLRFPMAGETPPVTTA